MNFTFAGVDADQGIQVGYKARQLASQGGAREQLTAGRIPDPLGDHPKRRRGHVSSWEDF